jgi:hypothetical protein
MDKQFQFDKFTISVADATLIISHSEVPDAQDTYTLEASSFTTGYDWCFSEETLSNTFGAISPDAMDGFYDRLWNDERFLAWSQAWADELSPEGEDEGEVVP